jgi:transcriptional regulator of acetoin/glycerol metabolism
LRERQDLEVVTRKILASVCHSATPMGISPEVMSVFHQFPWPGNFRQLFNLLRTAVVMAGCTEDIQLQHLPDDFMDEVQMTDMVLPRATISEVDMSQVASEPLKEAIREPAAFRFESTKLENVALDAMAQALRSSGGNVSVAAKMLGVSRNTIYRKKAQLPADVWG